MVVFIDVGRASSQAGQLNDVANSVRSVSTQVDTLKTGIYNSWKAQEISIVDPQIENIISELLLIASSLNGASSDVVSAAQSIYQQELQEERAEELAAQQLAAEQKAAQKLAEQQASQKSALVSASSKK